MKRFRALAIVCIALGACTFLRTPAKNPDPNHSHADFAVWIDGKQIDFSADKYMSGSSSGSMEDADHKKHDPYFHLHDANGHVIHRHKPGLPIAEFFASIGFKMTGNCFTLDTGMSYCSTSGKRWKLYVNGKEHVFDPGFVFADDDQLLLTYGAGESALQKELVALTKDACLYSQTCPWRGKPPSENCIADPAVPCTE